MFVIVHIACIRNLDYFQIIEEEQAVFYLLFKRICVWIPSIIKRLGVLLSLNLARIM